MRCPPPRVLLCPEAWGSPAWRPRGPSQEGGQLCTLAAVAPKGRALCSGLTPACGLQDGEPRAGSPHCPV